MRLEAQGRPDLRPGSLRNPFPRIFKKKGKMVEPVDDLFMGV
jgi:hypothetical protein